MCGTQTNGVFNIAKELIARMKQDREDAEIQNDSSSDDDKN